MAYASITDVRRLLTFLPQIVAPTNPASPIAEASALALWPASYKPNPTDMALYCDMATNDLDAALALADYETPVATAATGALGVLRSYAAEGAAALAAGAMPQGSDSKHRQMYQDHFDAVLMGIEKGERVLNLPRDPDLAGARTGPRAPSGLGASPYFTRDSFYDR